VIPFQVVLNTFASDVFRNQADQDYIVARAAYRLRCREQFLWSGLQALEKYFKGILLFNGLSARWPRGSSSGKEYGHDVVKLLGAVRAIAYLRFTGPTWLDDFVQYLRTFGDNRYLSTDTYTMGRELLRLDEAVWMVRRYCQCVNVVIDLPSGKKQPLRKHLIDHINDTRHRRRPERFRPFGAVGGLLERVLDRDLPARETLMWNNLFYGKRHRSRVRYRTLSSSEIPPHRRDWCQDPILLQRVEKYVRIPRT